MASGMGLGVALELARKPLNEIRRGACVVDKSDDPNARSYYRTRSNNEITYCVGILVRSVCHRFLLLVLNVDCRVGKTF